ncbi:MAG: YhcH/YjgK/YiaL family protein [Lachnospiraceae bacterium]|nr:YhcH/YjgK/YiaL family protein [Lachnospiraceae bacterium]MCI7596926.1 YhcH/YjgK/YiaL family protein [Lachnospiraceae bacterium]MDD7051016.1 YhcH/YjgK/YiaL family protein [Lachnospiraceae bacterium]MDY3221608.1 YhcH/YjgK/YiaL family protein [Lachnospiraceae bacterium]MDY4097581.1 YhcH/YjgK/YiaL family protein [Lachnospiraceae bacterium]
MIYDKLSNIGSYKGLNKNLDIAIAYITSHNLQELPSGKTLIDGENVYVNCMECETALLSSKEYEMHQEYMDIQIDLQGAERVITGDCSSMEMGQYNADRDCCFGQSTALADCTIGPENFIICMVGEPHMPGVALKNPETIKKCVFKVHK